MKLNRMPALLLLLPVLAGCDSSAAADPPEPTPSPSVISSTSFTGLTGDCPDLTGPAARAQGVPGPGRPTTEHDGRGARGSVIVDCEWAPGRPGGLAVSVRMSIHRTPADALAEWQLVSTGQERRMRLVGDEAYSAVEMPALVVRVRSGSAVATVRLALPDGVATEEGFEDLRPAATEICQDILDDLR